MREIFSKIVNIVPVEVEVVGHDDGADHADGLQQLIAPAPGALGQQHARDDGALDIVQYSADTYKLQTTDCAASAANRSIGEVVQSR